MTVGQLRRAIGKLRDDVSVIAHVTSAPFDDETVELIDVFAIEAEVTIRVAVVDDVTRELRREE